MGGIHHSSTADLQLLLLPTGYTQQSPTNNIQVLPTDSLQASPSGNLQMSPVGDPNALHHTSQLHLTHLSSNNPSTLLQAASTSSQEATAHYTVQPLAVPYHEHPTFMIHYSEECSCDVQPFYDGAGCCKITSPHPTHSAHPLRLCFCTSVILWNSILVI